MKPSDELRDHANDVLATLASGSDPLSWSPTGYGYEHMGDMARDAKPLAERAREAADLLDECEPVVRHAIEVARRYGETPHLDSLLARLLGEQP